ncbi:hypothetical protein, partial [Aeromicrobium sp.]|uniref:hypothetical protein n=1 Tax=Aeromicrobium sp. TaxID=1871063 RepID=UPI002FC6E9A4
CRCRSGTPDHAAVGAGRPTMPLSERDARPCRCRSGTPDHAAFRAVVSMRAPSCEAVAVSAEGFREPWFRLGADQAATLADEVMAEVGPGHELYGLDLHAVAKCEGCDDVVFRASDDSFAIVHLTWASKSEDLPRPLTTRLGGFIAVEAAMDQHEH